MNILEEIIGEKRKEVFSRKDLIPAGFYEKVPAFRRERPSFGDAIKRPFPSVIAEFKRKSPSRGVINSSAAIYETIAGYSISGASAISVLTDHNYFGGSLVDLQDSALLSHLPLLRKDFIIDEYQVIEAKAYGASAILLIASVLKSDQVKMLSQLANGLGIDVLFEIHDEKELDKWFPGIKIVGVNNRNLSSFRMQPERSLKLLQNIPRECIKVAESGISDAETVKEWFNAGFDAFLIGETFMKTEKPWITAKNFILDLVC